MKFLVLRAVLWTLFRRHSAYDDVVRFQRKLGFPVRESIGRPSEGTMRMRQRLIKEEVSELIEALEQGSLGEIAQESVDLLYVVYGTLASYGIRPEVAWNLVHRANMQKERNPEEHGKALKPAGWKKPNLEDIIREHQR